MLYTEDFSMRHYVGFSQIGSHMAIIMSSSAGNIVSYIIVYCFLMLSIWSVCKQQKTFEN